MKRFITILLAAVLLLSLCACGAPKAISIQQNGQELKKLELDLAEEYDEEELTLTAVLEPKGAKAEIEWESSDKDVVKVKDNGDGTCTLKLRGEGTAKITAECGELSAMVKIEVTDSSLNVGDYMTFGSYEQDNNTSNGKEPIEWLVLAKEDNKILVISKYGLDCQPYNTSGSRVTWESCSLRTWLNDDFMNKAFSSDEQAAILNENVPADKNPEYDTDPGNDTTDKIFILSIAEAEQYFSSDEDRECECTAYAEAQGSWTGDEGHCWWWLRSPGHYRDMAAYVSSGGSVDCFGNYIHSGHDCVRPALWINLDS